MRTMGGRGLSARGPRGVNQRGFSRFRAGRGGASGQPSVPSSRSYCAGTRGSRARARSRGRRTDRRSRPAPRAAGVEGRAATPGAQGPREVCAKRITAASESLRRAPRQSHQITALGDERPLNRPGHSPWSRRIRSTVCLTSSAPRPSRPARSSASACSKMAASSGVSGSSRRGSARSAAKRWAAGDGARAAAAALDGGDMIGRIRTASASASPDAGSACSTATRSALRWPRREEDRRDVCTESAQQGELLLVLTAAQREAAPGAVPHLREELAIAGEHAQASSGQHLAAVGDRQRGHPRGAGAEQAAPGHAGAVPRQRKVIEDAERVEQGGEHIEVGDRGVPGVGEGALLVGGEGAAAAGDEGGDVDLLVVEVLAVMDGPVLAERLAVIAGEEDEPRAAALGVDEGAEHAPWSGPAPRLSSGRSGGDRPSRSR